MTEARPRLSKPLDVGPESTETASQTEVIVYGSRTQPFTLTRSVRRTLAIDVLPSGVVHVRAPLDADVEAIRDRVRRRMPWVLRQQRAFSIVQRPASEKEYVSGETHHFLGRSLRLKVDPAEVASSEGVKREGRYLIVQTHRLSAQVLVERWYAAQAKALIPERFARACDRMGAYGIEPPPLILRRMSHRWGSCTAARRVVLNPALVQMPLVCIDYVAIHELCHLRHPNHGPDFYALLDRVMPEWRRWKSELDKPS